MDTSHVQTGRKLSSKPLRLEVTEEFPVLWAKVLNHPFIKVRPMSEDLQQYFYSLPSSSSSSIPNNAFYSIAHGDKSF